MRCKMYEIILKRCYSITRLTSSIRTRLMYNAPVSSRTDTNVIMCVCMYIRIETFAVVEFNSGKLENRVLEASAASRPCSSTWPPPRRWRHRSAVLFVNQCLRHHRTVARCAQAPTATGSPTDRPPPSGSPLSRQLQLLQLLLPQVHRRRRRTVAISAVRATTAAVQAAVAAAIATGVAAWRREVQASCRRPASPTCRGLEPMLQVIRTSGRLVVLRSQS